MEHTNDYAHCKTCDAVINLDTEAWHTDGDNTFCGNDKPEEEV